MAIPPAFQQSIVGLGPSQNQLEQQRYTLQDLKRKDEQGQIELREKQQQEQDQQNIRKVLSMGLPDDQAIQQFKMLGLHDVANQYQEGITKRNQEIAQADAATRQKYQAELEDKGRVAYGILQLPPAQRQQAWDFVRQNHPDGQSLSPQVPDETTLKIMHAHAISTAQQLVQANKSDTEERMLRTKGLKRDAQGNLIPLTREELGPTELADLDSKQSLADLRKAQTDLAEATEALRKAQANPNSPAYKLAVERLNVSKQNAQTAAARLGLSQDTFEMRAFGTNNGQALPGAMITEEGQPVGTSLQQNVRPTGQERNKGDMAISAHDQLQDIRKIVTNRPDIFGPAAGRKTDFTIWLGSQDPDAQAFRAARTIAGDHLAGTFGGRSEAALDALDSAIGQFKDNPAAVLAGLDQLEKANKLFIDKGTVKTVGSKAATSTTKTAPARPAIGTMKGGYIFIGGDPANPTSWKKQK